MSNIKEVTHQNHRAIVPIDCLKDVHLNKETRHFFSVCLFLTQSPCNSILRCSCHFKVIIFFFSKCDGFRKFYLNLKKSIGNSITILESYLSGLKKSIPPFLQSILPGQRSVYCSPIIMMYTSIIQGIYSVKNSLFEHAFFRNEQNTTNTVALHNVVNISDVVITDFNCQ